MRSEGLTGAVVGMFLTENIFYGQIVKGLLYLTCFAGIIAYFVTRGAEDLIGFFTLGATEENLWTGIPGDNSLTMLILYFCRVKNIVNGLTAGAVKGGSQ